MLPMVVRLMPRGNLPMVGGPVSVGEPKIFAIRWLGWLAIFMANRQFFWLASGQISSAD